MATIAEMREICQQRRPNAKGKMVWVGHWFNVWLTRYYSIYFTWVFVKLGISANAVTFMMIPLGLIGAALLVPHVLWLNILGLCFLMLAIVFDCVDGEVARWTGKSSIRGLYLDFVYHVLCHSLLYILCALHLYVWQGELKYLLLAFISYASSHCLQSLGLTFQIVRFQCFGELGSPEPRPKGTSDHPKGTSLISVIVSIFKEVLTLPFDKVVVELASAFSIFMIYAGITTPAVFIAWLLPAGCLLQLIAQTAYRYFVTLPNMSHTKTVTVHGGHGRKR